MRNARPSWKGLAVAALVAAAALVMVGLGIWQLQRLQQRRAHNAELSARLAEPPIDLNQQPDANPREYQPVQARGVYDFSQEIVLRNRAHLEAPGVHVLTPLRLSGSDRTVLVDRGWIPYDRAEPAVRAGYQHPVGQEVVITGIVRASQHRTLSFMPADPTLSPDQARLDAWFWVALDQIQAQMPYRLLPFYVEADAGADASVLPIGGHEIDLSNGPHLSYAIQWFAFATILVVGSVGLWRKRRGKIA